MAHADVAGGVPSGQAVTEGRWIVFEDESRAALAGVVRRTWGQRGVTPVIKLNGVRGGRENMVAFVAYRPGFEPGLVGRPRFDRSAVRSGARRAVRRAAVPDAWA